jgi:hypothetical protein
MMETKYRPSEKGQALILIILGFVVLLGFTALAVDGGMVYSDRRYAQNAADASSLAGGGDVAFYLEDNEITEYNWTSCPLDALSEGEGAAFDRAKSNITIDTNDYDGGHGVEAECGVESVSPFTRNYIDVKTRITMDTQPAFAHFVYRGDLTNTVEAVSRVYLRSNLGFGQAIIALNHNDCSGQSDGLLFHSATVDVEGSGVWTNGCLRGDGGPSNVVNATGGAINYFDDQGGLTGFTPPPNLILDDDQRLPVEDFFLEDPPDCSDPAAHNVLGSDIEDMVDSGTPLSPGLYCITGDVRIGAGDVFTATEVTLYMVTGLDDIVINGHADATLTAPSTNPNDPDPSPAVRGLLIYVEPFYPLPTPPQQLAEVVINGTAGFDISGTILAPTAEVIMLGTGDTTAFESQIIGWDVEIGGANTTTVYFNGDDQLSDPTYMQLHR